MCGSFETALEDDKTAVVLLPASQALHPCQKRAEDLQCHDETRAVSI